MTDELMAAFARWEAKGMPEADQTRQITDDPLAIIKRRPRLREIKDSEVLWLVAEVDRLRTAGSPVTPDQTRQIADPLERQRVALAHLEEAREEWKRQAAAWSAVRAEAIFELKEGRTWAEVAELVKVSIPTAWNIAHPK